MTLRRLDAMPDKLRPVLGEDADGVAADVANGTAVAVRAYRGDRALCDAVIRVERFVGYSELVVVAVVGHRARALRDMVPVVRELQRVNNCDRVRAHAKSEAHERLYKILGFNRHSAVMVL